MPIDGAAGNLSSLFTQFQTALLDQAGQADGVGQVQPGRIQPGQAGAAKKSEAVGQGNAAAADVGPAPDAAVPANAVTGGAIIAAALMSLGGIEPPRQSSDDVEAALAGIEAKFKESNNAMDKDTIKMDQARKLLALTAKMENINDANQKHAEAAEAHKHMSLSEKVKQAFSYIGAALTIAVGIIAIATGVGAVAGALLITAGVLMLAMAIDQTMQSVPGKDGQPGKGFIQMAADECAKVQYPNDPEKQQELSGKLAITFTVVLMAASIACSIAGSVVNPTGVEAVATELPELVADSEALESGATDAINAAGDAKTVMTSVSTGRTAASATSGAKTTVGIAEGVNDAASTGTDVAVQTFSYQADTATADVTNDNAANKVLEGVSNLIDQALDALMDDMKAVGERFTNILSGISDAMKDHGASLSHAKFRA